MKVERFCQILRQSVAKSEKEGTKILLRPNLGIIIKKDFVEKHKEEIIEGIKSLNQTLKKVNPNRTLKEGLSYINIAGCPEYHLEQTEALILLAVGKLLGIWDIFPDPEKMPELFEADPIGAFPYNSGYKIEE
jgi:hypothetical protein